MHLTLAADEASTFSDEGEGPSLSDPVLFLHATATSSFTNTSIHTHSDDTDIPDSLTQASNPSKMSHLLVDPPSVSSSSNVSFSDQAAACDVSVGHSSLVNANLNSDPRFWGEIDVYKEMLDKNGTR